MALSVSFHMDDRSLGWPHTLLHMNNAVDLPEPDVLWMTLMIAPLKPVNFNKGEPNAVSAANA